MTEEKDLRGTHIMEECAGMSVKLGLEGCDA